MASYCLLPLFEVILMEKFYHKKNDDALEKADCKLRRFKLLRLLKASKDTQC